MLRRMRKYIAGILVLMILSVSVVSAQTFVTCQQKKQTGHGYYQANCSGNSLRMTCYQSDSSERYHVNNYIGVSGNDYKYLVGVNAGRRNGSHSQNVGTAYNAYYHVHHYTVNLIQ